MSTDIYFAAGGWRLTVDEDPGEVAKAFIGAQGRPVRLTSRDDLAEVYVNSATVAFWSAAEASPQSGTRESREPAAKRAVVDLWGNPLGKKRRR